MLSLKNYVLCFYLLSLLSTFITYSNSGFSQQEKQPDRTHWNTTV